MLTCYTKMVNILNFILASDQHVSIITGLMLECSEGIGWGRAAACSAVIGWYGICRLTAKQPITEKTADTGTVSETPTGVHGAGATAALPGVCGHRRKANRGPSVVGTDAGDLLPSL